MNTPLKLVPKPGPRWHELERLLPYRDLIGMVGVLLLAACISLFSWRAGVGFAGLALVGLSWLMAQAAKAAKPVAKPVERLPHASL